jgi:hypothetical protein
MRRSAGCGLLAAPGPFKGEGMAWHGIQCAIRPFRRVGRATPQQKARAQGGPKAKRDVTYTPAPADDADDADDNDACMACQEAGELLWCDACPNAYHIHCLEPQLASIPEGMACHGICIRAAMGLDGPDLDCVAVSVPCRRVVVRGMPGRRAGLGKDPRVSLLARPPRHCHGRRRRAPRPLLRHACSVCQTCGRPGRSRSRSSLLSCYRSMNAQGLHPGGCPDGDRRAAAPGPLQEAR